MNLNIFSDLRKPGLVPGKSLSPSTKFDSVLGKNQTYKERNVHNRLLTYHKKQTISKKIIESKNDTKQLFHLVNNITMSKTPNPMPEAKKDAQLAGESASLFLDKIEKIRLQFQNTDQYILEVNASVPRLQDLLPLSNEDIEREILSMSNKTCELDAIPKYLIKDILPAVLKSITQIVNMSLTTGTFPLDWKTAIIRPLIKKAGLELIKKNYRPVSNLCSLSKLVEHCLLKQYLKHCDDNCLLPDFQSAYCPNYSTETSLVRMTNDILWAMEEQHITMMVILEVSAAFDTVDHNILLKILENQFGVTDTALKWFDSYLRPRSFKLCIGDEYSECQKLSFGVPQGSCSGANIFTYYCSLINKEVSELVTINGFADDHSQ